MEEGQEKDHGEMDSIGEEQSDRGSSSLDEWSETSDSAEPASPLMVRIT